MKKHITISRFGISFTAEIEIEIDHEGGDPFLSGYTFPESIDSRMDEIDLDGCTLSEMVTESFAIASEGGESPIDNGWKAEFDLDGEIGKTFISIN